MCKSNELKWKYWHKCSFQRSLAWIYMRQWPRSSYNYHRSTRCPFTTPRLGAKILQGSFVVSCWHGEDSMRIWCGVERNESLAPGREEALEMSEGTTIEEQTPAQIWAGRRSIIRRTIETTTNPTIALATADETCPCHRWERDTLNDPLRSFWFAGLPRC